MGQFFYFSTEFGMVALEPPHKELLFSRALLGYICPDCCFPPTVLKGFVDSFAFAGT